MLPPLAPLDEFELRIPGGVPGADADRAEAALVDASTLVRSEAGKDWVTGGVLDDDVPDIVVTVTMSAAKRAFVNPDGVRSESVDDFSQSFSDSSPDVYLTKREKSAIRKAVGRGGLWTQPTTRSDDDVPDVATVFLDVEPSGEKMPWAPSTEPF